MSDPNSARDPIHQAILDQLKNMGDRLERLERRSGIATPPPARPSTSPPPTAGDMRPWVEVVSPQTPAPTPPPRQLPVPPSPGFRPVNPPPTPAELRGLGSHPTSSTPPAAPPTSPPAHGVSPTAAPRPEEPASLIFDPPSPSASPTASGRKAEAFHSLSGTGPRPVPPPPASHHPPVAPPVVPLMARRFDGAPSPSSSPSAPPAPPPSKPINLEWLIGTKGLAAAGALAVVIGVIFFLKYAVEQGWIGNLPPLLRCMMGVGFGGLLVAAGEVVRRKVNALGGAGLYAAGIACAYASVYAGYGYFNPPVIGQTTAFIALVLISGLGVALSAGTRLAGVAIVSLVGAYLAPFLLRSDNPNPLVFPVYSSALLATGLVLAAWLRGSFRWVGRSVWWATMVLGGLWAAVHIDREPVIVIGFVLCVWAMIHAAHIVAARGGFTSGDDDAKPSTHPGSDSLNSLRNSGPMLSSFSVTGWATILMTLALRELNPAIDWIAPGGIAVATGVLAVWLAGHLGVIKNRPRTDAERLGASLALQSAGALIGAVALATSSAGPAAALLWLVMGLGAIIAGRWAGALAATIYGTLLMLIGTARLVLWDSWHSSLFSPTVDLFGLALAPWTAWAGLAALAWFAAAWVVSLGTPEGKRSIWGAVNAVAAVGLLVASLINPDSSPHATTWAVLGLCVVLIGVHRLRRQLALHVHTLVLLALTTAKIVLVDAFTGRVLTETPRLLGLPLTPSLWLCIGAAAAWGAIALAARSMIGKPSHPQALSNSVACSMIALLMLLLAPVNQDMQQTHLVWPWAIVSVLASLASRFDPRLALRTGATIAAFMSAGAWVIAWVFMPGFVHWSTSYPALLHPGLLSAVAVVAALIAVAKVSRATPGRGDAPLAEALPAACLIAAGALGWLASSFEASRIAEMVTGSVTARGAAVSIWWGLLAVTLLYIGFRKVIPGLRYAGLTLLGLAGVKVVLFDMADAPQLARVAGFVTLGLLMLGTAVGYARVAKALDASKPEAGNPAPPAA